jgi:acetyl-CoA C-acetyltransferase
MSVNIMRDVSIIGIGQTKIGEHWDISLRHLALEAILGALRDGGIEQVDMLLVGNMLSGALTAQEHLGALIADFAGLRGVEAFKIEAACGSGAAAARLGYIAVAGGMADVVLVVGVEKMTDRKGDETTAALAMAADADFEVIHGLSFVSVNALLMRRYMHEFGVPHDAFAPFTINSHRNAVANPYAMFPFPVRQESFQRAPMIADPINLMDSSPICDGAAAIVVCPTDMAQAIGRATPVRVLASAAATDTVAVHDRRDPLVLEGVTRSTQRAYQLAEVQPADIDLFELHDAFSIMSVLSLEACGFAERGKGTRLGLDGEITIDGKIPVCTMGGLKARGHPVGATGVYQLVEAVQQLRGEAGANQVADARLAMTQNIGGSGATVITHILESIE